MDKTLIEKVGVVLIRVALMAGRIIQRGITSMAAQVTPKASREIALFGICEDRNGSYISGPALAPPLLKKTLRCESGNDYSELGGLDIISAIKEYDDIVPPVPDSEATSLLIKERLETIHRDGRLPLMIGGDHSLTYPMVKALKQITGRPFVIVHFDAHPDIYPDFQGNPWSHASPFARIMEAGDICTQLISCGVRTAGPQQIGQLSRYPVKWIEAKHFPLKGNLS